MVTAEKKQKDEKYENEEVEGNSYHRHCRDFVALKS
jgi:hypothetical protein